MHTDWQTWVTLAVGAGATVYMARRWWPALKGLFHAGPGGTAKPACGTDGVSAPAASCSSGCGNCGQPSATPAKDHRVHIHRRSAD